MRRLATIVGQMCSNEWKTFFPAVEHCLTPVKDVYRNVASTDVQFILGIGAKGAACGECGA